MKKQPKTPQRSLHTEVLETRYLFAATVTSLLGGPAAPSYSVNGSGNNLAHPDWGSAGSDLLRTIPAAYGNGISTPNGQTLPSGRVISNALGDQTTEDVDPRELTAFTYAWGQFIDHDLDLTPDGGASLPITVPKGDSTFDPAGIGGQLLRFTRAQTDPATGTSRANPLNQVTVVTGFLDGSMVYGSDATRAAALRTFQGGQLKTSAGNLLPLNTSGLPNDNNGPYPASNLYLAGDVRANENVELTSLQTVFMREHNQWAAKIAAANPSLSDEQIFQRARSIVIAEIQSITFNQFLPAILGTNAIDRYTGYKANVNPGITPEFSEAAFRFGHSQLDDDVEFVKNSGAPLSFTYTLPNGVKVPVNTPDDIASGETGISLVDAFFNPYLLKQPGVTEGVLKYLASDVAQNVDTQMVDAVRNILFGAPGSGAGGQDLFALDVQRGRDVGLPTYNVARVAYGLPAVTSFAQISSDPATQQALKTLYGDVNKVELFVGGLAEDHARGSMGATFQAIIADQFERLRNGDRLWYENTFSGAALRTIQNTTLADILERNTGLRNLQDNVFLFKASVSGNIFADTNGNGRQDNRENGLTRQTVQLTDAITGAVVATTKSDSRGHYSFDLTSTGQYLVQAVSAAGVGIGPQRAATISSGDQNSQVNIGLNTPGGPRATNVAQTANAQSLDVLRSWIASMPGNKPGTRSSTLNSDANFNALVDRVFADGVIKP